MLKPHYIHTREGVAEALRLKSNRQLPRYIKKAKELGLENISKILGGIEYFDPNMLKNPELYTDFEL
jgi:hypothetical protein